MVLVQLNIKQDYKKQYLLTGDLSQSSYITVVLGVATKLRFRFAFLCVHCSQGHHSQIVFDFFAAGFKCQVAAVCLTVFHHGALFISASLGNTEFIVVSEHRR